MKNIVVIGANGMLGYAVSEYYNRKNYSVTKISRLDFDITKDPIEKLEPILTRSDFVINCAGVIKPMIVTTSIEDVLRVNAIFPRNLAKLSDKLGLHCYHVTTDCVYSGKRGDYTENDFFDADDVYGMSKTVVIIRNVWYYALRLLVKKKGKADRCWNGHVVMQEKK